MLDYCFFSVFDGFFFKRFLLFKNRLIKKIGIFGILSGFHINSLCTVYTVDRSAALFNKSVLCCISYFKHISKVKRELLLHHKHWLKKDGPQK